MGWFSSDKSWTNQAKTEPNRTGLFGSKTWTSNANKADKARKRCPPITDCRVKQSLMASAAEQRRWGVRTKKEVKAAEKLAKKITAAQRAGRRAPAWPYAGSYDPNKGKQRGRGR